MKLSTKFFKNEDGATAIEYGLIAALIAVAAIAAMTSLGENLSGTFTNVGDKLDAANTAS
jgi:pilus assembly protein Flp/PilA